MRANRHRSGPTGLEKPVRRGAVGRRRSLPPEIQHRPRDGLLTLTNETPDTIDVIDWGFTPGWAAARDDVPEPINARSEKLATSGMYQDAFENRRCLILADGFFEWLDQPGSKQPYRICRTDRAPFAFAGIWSQFETKSGGTQATTAIVTTDANEVVQEVHDRMPVILARDEERTWLEGDVADATDVLDPFPPSSLEAYPVSKQVNNPDYESPDLFDPIEIGNQTGLDDFAG